MSTTPTCRHPAIRPRRRSTKGEPDLVARDEEGKPYTVRYEAANAMLLNEFLKARRQIDALIAGLERVSTQLQMNKAAPQMVLNNP